MFKIDPRLHTWLYSFLIFLSIGGIAFYVLTEAETVTDETRTFFVIGYAFVFLLGVIIYQWVIIGHKAEVLAAHMTSDLSSSRELFLNLFRNSPISYVLIDKAGKITLANTAAIRLFGVTKGGLDGRNIFDLIAPEEGGDKGTDRMSFITSLFHAGNFINDEELETKSLDGTNRWVLFSAFPFGAKHNGLVTLVDITKQKEIDIAKTEFVSLASHQMRTPLSSMSWNIELLASDKFGQLTNEQNKLVSRVERGLHSMNAIIKDFLDVSHLELGTFASHPSGIHLTAFFNEVSDEFVEQVATKQINFQKEYSDEDVTITTDKRLLHMVVSNLISNAVKYTPEGGVVKVGYQVEVSRLVISVSDTGIGVPLEDQDRLFTRFFRASNARNAVIKGTGLGLYIAKKSLAILGGEISFTSVPGAGTTFTITLPR